MVATPQAVDEALAAFGHERTGPLAEVPDSILNDNYRVETDRGVRFLKFVRASRTPEILAAEHRSIAFAQEHGVPVAAPLPALSGGTVAHTAAGDACLFPFIEGRTAKRGKLTEGEARAIGRTQGQLTRVFADYGDPVLSARSPGEVRWDTKESISVLFGVDNYLSGHLYGIEERMARSSIRLQLGYLESGDTRRWQEFTALPTQIDHGDIHERNVLLALDSDDVVAVIDWERIRRLPRAFQMLRAADFCGLMAGGPLDAFFEAYGQEVRLGRDECEMAVEAWWQSVLHNTWVYTEVYERGGTRATPFLQECAPRLRRLSNPSNRKRLAGRIARFAAD